MIGIPLGLAVFGYGEWATHKYLLHGLGRDRKSRFSFHYHEHHQAVRRNGGYDPAYEGPPWSSTTQAREAIGLILVGLAHAPLFPVAPFYTSTIWYCLARYRRDHRHAHLDPAWGRDHLSHHYDHHMGDQDMNFGVVWSWLDSLVGTREVFVGSDHERTLHAKHVARARTASAGASLRAQRRNPLRRLLGARR
jgi:Fatty acid hydroxylase superfamily